MFKFVALSFAGEGLSTITDIPRFINNRDNKPFFSDVIFEEFNNIPLTDKELTLLKAKVKFLHDHGVRAHFKLSSDHPQYIAKTDAFAEKAKKFSDNVITHLILDCKFDGISLEFAASEEGIINIYEYAVTLATAFKTDSRFTGKTLSFYSEVESPPSIYTSEAERHFIKDKKHGHQLASLFDEIHILGHFSDEYKPKQSSNPDDKYYESGMPKDKFFTYGDFTYEALNGNPHFNFTQSQIQLNKGCMGIIGRYHYSSPSHDYNPSASHDLKANLQRPIQLAGYTLLLRTVTGNDADQVIFSPH